MKQWETYNCEGVSINNTPPGCNFKFPSAPGHVNYIQRRAVAGERDGQISGVNFSFKVERISGSPIFKAVQDGGQLFVRVMLRRDDDEQMLDDYGRYWTRYGQLVRITEGSDIQVPMNPVLWQDVNGKGADEHLARFLDLQSHLGWVAFTFGNNTGFGHGGVIDRGEARFVCLKLSAK